MAQPLMVSRHFAPLFWCQFLSAFNDNFLKNALVFLILFGMPGARGEALITVAGGVFIFPFFVLSGLGGQLADRFDKARVTRYLKFAEIAAAGLAAAGFATQSLPILFASLLLFGIVAALFGPIKYGILPDYLPTTALPAGNALIEGGTFLAILLAMLAAALATGHGVDRWWFAVLVIIIAVACWVASLFMVPTGNADPSLKVEGNLAHSTLALLRDLRADRRLMWGALVLSWFWVVGATVLALLGPIVKNVLGGNQDVVLVFLAVFSVGIAIGSALAAWLASGRIVLLPTVIGAVLLGLCSLDFASVSAEVPSVSTLVGPRAVFASARGWHTLIDLLGLAIAGGLFVVPTFAAVQAWAGAERRARVVAAVNVLNAAFMVAGAAIVAAAQDAGLSVAAVFLAMGAACLLVAFLIARTMPTHGVADLVSIIFRAFYRLEIKGMDNLEAAGRPCIAALNHVSFLDAPLALAVLGRDVVFAIDSGMAKRWWVRPLLGLAETFPLDPTRPMAIRTLVQVVKAGKNLVIFPEGRLTVTGSVMKVYDGAGLIADKTGALVVPIHHEGLEATVFSRLTRQQVRRRWLPKVKVTVLEPVQLKVDPALKGKLRRQAAGTALYEIMSDLVFRTTSTDRTVIEAIIEAAKLQGPGRTAVEDPLSGPMSYRKLLAGANVLGRKFAGLAEVGAPIGVMMPNATVTAVTILGVMSAGRVPAMINFTAGSSSILAACKAADIGVIATSRAFVSKGRLDDLIAQLEPAVRLVYLEDIRVGPLDKVQGLFGAFKPLRARQPSDPAVILFTSGSEGMPKGVVLSHRNMLANVAQAKARIDFGRTDTAFNVLPMFHSFGLTIGLVLPLVSGVKIYLYPNPLHFRNIPELVYGTNATILFGTDTFLAGYAKAAHPYDFRSLRYVLAGAERVKETTRKTYLDKFGLRILEGYGATETAPALALNTPMYNKSGTVGRLLPGLEARLEPVSGLDDGGRLFVSGPNVMLGYLRVENPTVLEPPPQGWHDTGDIVSIDSQGFITIKDRAKRFAKIAGEMVSLSAVEELATSLWPDARSVAVSVPDPRKGERIVLLTEQSDAARAPLVTYAKSKGAADNVIPSEVIVVERIPLLGSGKTDIAAASKLANDPRAAA
jgi:acyl-[acyl-carrier-protein]-phospholipid O-acyltransferase / long-chain-fatty-acid--[acyl-carrier-protein] ligase